MEDWKKNVIEIVEGALTKIDEHAKESYKEIAERNGDEVSGPQVGFLEIEGLVEPAARLLEALEFLMYESTDLQTFNDNYSYLMEQLDALYDTAEFEDGARFPTK